MAAGERNKFGAPMFELEVFRKQMYCFEKSAYDIVVTFWALQLFGARGISPLAPLVTSPPLFNKNQKIFRK